MNEKPDTIHGRLLEDRDYLLESVRIHGRLLEAVHVSGYTFERAMGQLKWLLQEDKWKQCGYKTKKDFLNTITFKEFRMSVEDRKEFSKLLVEEHDLSLREAADVSGVSYETIRRDVTDVTKKEEYTEEKENIVTNVTPPPTITRDGVEVAELAEKETAKEEKKVERKEEIERIIKQDIKSPEGIYDVICYDPPWPYGTEYDPKGRRAASPYPEQSLEWIKDNLPAPAENCVLFLWTTHRFMRAAFPLIDGWGFRDVAIGTWIKDRIGLGTYLRSQSEFFIMAIKGKPNINLTNQSTIIYGSLREHSRKPDDFYRMVRELCPGRRKDFPAREPHEGFEIGGNEVNKWNGVNAPK